MIWRPNLPPSSLGLELYSNIISPEKKQKQNTSVMLDEEWIREDAIGVHN